METNKMETNLKIKETLFSDNEKKFLKFRKINRIFSFIVATFPIFAALVKFVFPNLMINLFCAFLIYLPYIFEKRYNIIVLEEFKFIITFHTMLHSVFGKTFHFYDKYPIYDSILHVLGGGLIGLVAFSIVLSLELNYSKHTKKFLLFKTSLSSLSIVNTLGVGWEILEFIGDLIFRGTPGYRLAQEDSLFDTMTDLIENNVGAIFAIIFFLKLIKKNNKKERDMESLFKKLAKDIELPLLNISS